MGAGASASSRRRASATTSSSRELAARGAPLRRKVEQARGTAQHAGAAQSGLARVCRHGGVDYRALPARLRSRVSPCPPRRSLYPAGVEHTAQILRAAGYDVIPLAGTNREGVDLVRRFSARAHPGQRGTWRLAGDARTPEPRRPAALARPNGPAGSQVHQRRPLAGSARPVMSQSARFLLAPSLPKTKARGSTMSSSESSARSEPGRRTCAR